MSAQAKVNIWGVLAALGAGIAFSIIDTIAKFLSGDYPLHELVLVRSIVALAVLLAVIMPLEGGYHLLRTHQPRLHLLRCDEVSEVFKSHK